MRDDLFDALRTPPPAQPLPAAEVRRRGDRLRRRRTALQVVGVTAAVALIAGGALSATGRLGTEPPPVQPPKEVAAIPADFPLTAGWPASGGDVTRDAMAAPQVSPCVEELALPKPAHWRGASVRIPPGGRQRQLFVYASAAEAQRALDAIWAEADGCRPPAPAEESITQMVTAASRLGGGVRQISWQESSPGVEAIGASALQAFRSGSALLVSTLGNEGGRADAVAEAEQDHQQLAPALSAMCRWTVDGCEPAGIGLAPVIPDDFPLIEGWGGLPADGDRTGPGPQVTPLEFYQCNSAARVEGSGHRLTASQTSGSSGQGRELHTFPTREQAAEAARRLRAELADCRSWVADQIYEYTAELRDVPGGFQVLEWGRAAHAEVTTVIQRGHAVLVSVTATESTGRAATEALAVQERELVAPVADALCLFDNGCATSPEPTDLPQAALLTAADLQATVAPFIRGAWTQVPDRDDPTLDCQSGPLRQTAPTGLAYREWTGPGRARAATAVLSHTSLPNAIGGYEDLVMLLENCTGGTPMEGARELTLRGEVVRRGTSEMPQAWGIYTGPLPEECTACDSGWFDVQGVTRVGNLLVVVSVGGPGDLQFPPAEADWMGELLAVAASRATAAS